MKGSKETLRRTASEHNRYLTGKKSHINVYRINLVLLKEGPSKSPTLNFSHRYVLET
jgi:hypothetical protein